MTGRPLPTRQGRLRRRSAVLRILDPRAPSPSGRHGSNRRSAAPRRPAATSETLLMNNSPDERDASQSQHRDGGAARAEHAPRGQERSLDQQCSTRAVVQRKAVSRYPGPPRSQGALEGRSPSESQEPRPTRTPAPQARAHRGSPHPSCHRTAASPRALRVAVRRKMLGGLCFTLRYDRRSSHSLRSRGCSHTRRGCTLPYSHSSPGTAGATSLRQIAPWPGQLTRPSLPHSPCLRTSAMARTRQVGLHPDHTADLRAHAQPHPLQDTLQRNEPHSRHPQPDGTWNDHAATRHQASAF